MPNPHPPPAPPPDASRRSFLRALLGVTGAAVLGTGAVTTLAGCEPLGSSAGDAAPAAEYAEFLAGTVAVAALYQSAVDAVPELATRLAPLLAAHQAHARELAEALGTQVPESSGTASVPSDRAGAVAALAAAERTGRTAAVNLCLSAPARLAPLLGSIAAARATHLEVLR
ncbi:MAG TPA: hypothetical protein VF163_04195 [Micromonosporaceae bacterium]